MTINGYVRERTDSDDWCKDREAPHGFRVVIVDEFRRPVDTNWTRLPWPMKCRWTVGPGHRSCRKAAIVALNRGRSNRRNLWGYCPEHLYGRRWDNGTLLSAILVKADEQP